MEDTTLSRQQSEKHLDQGDMASSAFSNRDNLCSSVSHFYITKSYPRILHSSPIRCLMHSIFQATIGRPDILIHENISEALTLQNSFPKNPSLHVPQTAYLVVF